MTGPDTLAATVVAGVLARTDTPRESLPPLYDSVDMDAVRMLLDHADERSDADVGVEFDYAGCRVAVEDGEVVIDGEERQDFR